MDADGEYYSTQGRRGAEESQSAGREGAELCAFAAKFQEAGSGRTAKRDAARAVANVDAG